MSVYIVVGRERKNDDGKEGEWEVSLDTENLKSAYWFSKRFDRLYESKIYKLDSNTGNITEI